jgi:hypothetical protein
MPQLRQLRPDRFVALPHETVDHLPSLEALGLLAHLLRHTDAWLPSIEELAATKAQVTRRTASKARKTLLAHGYYISVRYRHNNRFATDIWRSASPHSEADLLEIARRYTPGSAIRTPEIQDGRVVRDANGEIRYRWVRIQWAQIESWRGREIVGEDGSLIPTSTSQPRPTGSGRSARPAKTESSRPTGSGRSARPAKTDVSPGRPDLPLSGGSGDGRSKRKREEEKREHHHGGDDESSSRGGVDTGTPGGMEEARALLERVRQRCAPELRVLPSYVTAVGEQLAAGHSAAAIERVLTEARSYRSPAAGVVEQVRALPDLLASQPQRRPVPPWCGECDPVGRMAEAADGRPRRCPRCHPGATAAAGSGD